MNKTIIVTVASSGFGKAIVLLIAKNGYRITMTGERLRAL